MGNKASVVSQVADQVQNAVETFQQPAAAVPQQQQQAAPAPAPAPAPAAQCQPGEVATGKLMVENASIKIGVSKTTNICIISAPLPSLRSAGAQLAVTPAPCAATVGTSTAAVWWSTRTLLLLCCRLILREERASSG